MKKNSKKSFKTDCKTTKQNIEIDKILESGQALLEKIQQMNPNSSKFSLQSELCEAEFRDVLNLDKKNIKATIALSELFYEYYNENASEEALMLLRDTLIIDAKNRIIKTWIKKHEEVLKEYKKGDN